MLIPAELRRDFEIVIGLVASIGTDLTEVSALLSDELRVYGYNAKVIRLSQLFDKKVAKESLAYYRSRMDACDEFRERIGSGDAVAALAIGKLEAERGGNRDQRNAWLFRTIKHDEEVRLLRRVFGSRFVLLGVHQSLASREVHLRRLGQDSGLNEKRIGAEVSELIRRDEMDESTLLGQRVRNAFSLSDYFLDFDDDLKAGVSRVIGLLFGRPFITPTRDEMAMYLAHSSSLRSADPGRQVGAVVVNRSRDSVAIGANEVPQSGGGEYWDGDLPDHRDFADGVDFNRREVRRTFAEALDVLAAGGVLVGRVAMMESEERLEVALKEVKGISRTRLLSLIEFGRIVHAEMSALMQAARSGVSVLGGTIYTTAFPCHMCMRLIIAAGIERVVFVDPYPKSLASEMYANELRGGVRVDVFQGSHWRIFASVFDGGEGSNRGRDATGVFDRYSAADARFRLAEPDPLVGTADLEAFLAIKLSDAMDSVSNKDSKG